MSAYAAAAAAVRTALEHLRGAETQGKDATLIAAIGDLERVATLLTERAKPAAPPRVCAGCGSTKCRPGQCNRATAPKPAASPAATPPAKGLAAPAAPPKAKPEKPAAAPRDQPAATPPAPDDFSGLKGYARLRRAVKDAEGLKTVPKGDRASLLARLEKAKQPKPATPTVPGLFVPDGKGGYRPATEAEVWQALDAVTGKKVA